MRKVLKKIRNRKMVGMVKGIRNRGRRRYQMLNNIKIKGNYT